MLERTTGEPVRPPPEGVVSIAEVLLYMREDCYVSLREAAAYLAISERNLRARFLAMPHYRVGGKILFKRSELDTWMGRHKKTSSDLDLDRLATEAVNDLEALLDAERHASTCHGNLIGTSLESTESRRATESIHGSPVP
jgi:excisionase family DNA binding protein